MQRNLLSKFGLTARAGTARASVAGRAPHPSGHSAGLHVAIIMDGNGRWAHLRNLPRTAGHHAGVGALREIVHAAPGAGIATLTVYAFSSDNWTRPAAEIGGIFALLRSFLDRELARLVAAGVRLTFIGRRDRVPGDVLAAIAHAEVVTAPGTTLHLRIALDYSARDSILRAASARNASEDANCRDAFAARLMADGAPDVDLMIRTGGEQRLSDFLLWECAYAELYFTACLWPDFDTEALADALMDFHARDRRFGGLSPAVTTPALPAE